MRAARPVKSEGHTRPASNSTDQSPEKHFHQHDTRRDLLVSSHRADRDDRRSPERPDQNSNSRFSGGTTEHCEFAMNPNSPELRR